MTVAEYEENTYMSVRLNGLDIAPGCCPCPRLTDAVFTECSLRLDVRMTLSRWRCTEDDTWWCIGGARHTETSVRCSQCVRAVWVSQAWPSVELSTRRLCSRHGTGQVGAGGPAPLSPSDHRCPPPVSWHRGMSLNIGSRGHKREDRTWVSRGPSSVVSTGKKCHTHWDYQMINPLYLVIFRPDSRHLLTWADKSDGNRWELLGVAVFEFYISLPTLFLCLVSTWHEIMDRSRKGNIWFILFYATLK